ncbi:MAG: ABC transporter ATP-binding protein [Anaerolineae bacterium]|nr:ABC transporter ATP-binding protein [Anaerolineae bacterium]
MGKGIGAMSKAEMSRKGESTGIEFAIATSGLVRRFGSLTAVDHLDLQVPAGSVYGFLGPNGAGKTTTIRMLLGLIRPDAGEVRLFGSPLRRERNALLRRVGALVDVPSLYPHLTGRENLEVVRRLLGGRRKEIDRVLQIVRLESNADRCVREYSHGMRQRLGLALALFGEPDLLILDEPTNGLDPAGMIEVRDLIRRLPEEAGTTVFLSSHLLGEVEQVATHIGIIREGRFQFQGTLQSLQLQMQPQVVLDVDRPDRATDLLRRAGWTVRSNDNRRLVVEANGPSDAAMINAQLVQGGLNVFHLVLAKPSLEETFLKLTNGA